MAAHAKVIPIYKRASPQAYLCRILEEHIKAITAQAGGKVSESELRERVGAFLLAGASGSLLHDSQFVPEMRTETSARYEVTSGPSPVHVRARHRLSLEARRRIAAAQRARWKKFHAKQKKKQKTGARGWGSMTKAERSKEMLRRRAVAALNKTKE